MLLVASAVTARLNQRLSRRRFALSMTYCKLSLHSSWNLMTQRNFSLGEFGGLSIVIQRRSLLR